MRKNRAEIFTNYKLLTLLIHAILFIIFGLICIVNIALFWGYLVGLINFIILALYQHKIIKLIFSQKKISTGKIILLHLSKLLIVAAFLCYLFFFNKLFLVHKIPGSDGSLYPINIITYCVAFIPPTFTRLWTSIVKSKLEIRKEING
ncbi:hypothetical protein [Mycoplasma zalophi]|uniref:Uncharacterized protein n=1 Tax=Mycoplasma zalophi TaxID=191287 RepID=A0ABS6DPG4_9MOLU|nr:hypothetical protein [Mycoplasma zalophi]MBU4691009.1 hypothetical protein [Mycoplasma zalophi]MBU4692212.1 hypothetical protein [Mycoplasma zalophi]